MRIEAPANLEAITNEADYQTLVVDALRRMGWVVIHIKEMFGNPKGVPDLLCFKGVQRDMYVGYEVIQRGQMIELKVGKNMLSPGQKRWIERWVPEGTEVLVIKNTAEDWNRMMDWMEV